MRGETSSTKEREGKDSWKGNCTKVKKEDCVQTKVLHTHTKMTLTICKEYVSTHSHTRKFTEKQPGPHRFKKCTILTEWLKN